MDFMHDGADRRGALRADLASCGYFPELVEDTVLLAGKGHESGQEIAGVIHPFDDALVLHNALRRSTRPTGGA